MIFAREPIQPNMVGKHGPLHVETMFVLSGEHPVLHVKFSHWNDGERWAKQLIATFSETFSRL